MNVSPINCKDNEENHDTLKRQDKMTKNNDAVKDFILIPVGFTLAIQ